jgi:hypothetical protein
MDRARIPDAVWCTDFVWGEAREARGWAVVRGSVWARVVVGLRGF